MRIVSGRRARVNGLVLWRGKSLLDGKRIVVVVTGIGRRSSNAKTGDLLQTWILREGENPVEALFNGADFSVCGNCKHRPALGGSCYVNVGQAPLGVWRAWKRGAYPVFNPRLHLSLFSGRILRMGSYGDPTAVPLDVWLPLIVCAEGHAGYTHQWRATDQDWRRFVMASCDTEQEREQAVQLGWRTFRVRGKDQPLMAGEFSCPASAESGYKRSCATCRACDGATDSGSGASPAIVVHGAKARRFALSVV